MAFGHIDHPYAIIGLEENKVTTEDIDNTGDTTSDQIVPEKTNIFKGSPRKVLVEGIQGASLNILHSIAENDDFLGQIGNNDFVDSDGNGIDSDETLSGDDMEMENGKTGTVDEVDGSGGLNNSDDDQDIEEFEIEKGKVGEVESDEGDTLADKPVDELNTDIDIHPNNNEDGPDNKKEGDAIAQELDSVDSTIDDKSVSNGAVNTENGQNINSASLDEQKKAAGITTADDEKNGEFETMETSINENEAESDDEGDGEEDEEKTSGQQVQGLTLRLVRKRGRSKKRKRSSGKCWTPKRIRRGPSGGSPRRINSVTAESVASEVGADIEANGTSLEGKDEYVDLEDVNKAEGSSQTEGESRGDPGNGSVVEERLKRRSRTPISQSEYLMGDEPILDEGANTEEPYSRKRKSLLFDKGRKASPSSVKPLTPEEAEKFKEPFNHGWRREIVIRGVYDDESAKSKRNPPADVYYFPPTGNKIRSMVQITEWLSKHNTPLTVDNFTFMRKAIGIGEGEVVRHAAMSRGRAASDVHKKKKAYKPMDEHVHDDDDPQYDVPEVVIERDSDDFLMPIIAAGIASPDGNSSLKIGTPPKLGRPLKPAVIVKPPPSEVKTETVEMIHPSNEHVIVSPSKKKVKSTARKSTSQKTFRRPVPYTGVENLCSLTCPGLEGMAPMLHCNVCMCLFHNECVNYYGCDGDFICLRCKGMDSKAMDSMSNFSPSTSVMTVSTPIQMARLSQSGSPMAIQLVKGSSNMFMSSRPSPGMSPSAQLIRVTVPASSQVTTPLYKSLVYENISGSGSPVVTETYLAYSPNASSPLVSLNMASKSKSQYQEIRPNIQPALKVKQEPVDDSYDTGKSEQKKGGQASTEALGTLKNVLASRQTGLTSVNGSILVNQLNQPSIAVSSSYMTSSLLNSNSLTSVSMSPLTFSLPSTSSLMNSSISALSRLSSNPLLNTFPTNTLHQNRFNLVPIGTSFPMPNMPNAPFQQVRIPELQGFIPLSNIRAQMPIIPASNTIQTSGTAIIPEPANKTVVVSSSPSLSTSMFVQSKQTDVQNNTTGPVFLNASSVGAPMNGQLLTLPPAVAKRLTLNKPLALKINNRQINIPPSGFFHCADGFKVFLPPNTFPTADEAVNLSVLEDKEQDVDSNKQSNLDQSKGVNSQDVIKTTNTDMNIIDLKSKNAENLKATTADQTSSSAEKTSDNETVDKAGDKKEVTLKPKLDIRKSKRYSKCCLIQRLYGGFDCMYHIFQYLNIKDLLSSGMVCRTWRGISMHLSLWRQVSFSGMMVSDWQKAMKFLRKRQVESMSLIGLTHYEDPNRTWHQLVSSLQDQPTLTKISFGLVPSSVVHSLCGRLTSLEAFCAECISDFNNESMWSVPTKLDIGKFSCLTELKELRLKGVGGLYLPSFSFSGGLTELAKLTNLEVLSVTSLKNVTAQDFNFISEMANIRELALGECSSWTAETYSHLGKMTWLTKLRLEHGGEIPDSGLGEALANLTQLETLELYTYTVSETLGDHLLKLPKLTTLVIWPDNSHSPAEVNTNTLSAVQKLTTLEKLDWVIPNSSSTSIILDDNDNTESVSTEEKEENQHWIPFLIETNSADVDTKADGQVVHGSLKKKQMMEYIGVRQLTDKITKLLPKTRIKVYCLKSEHQ